MKRNQRKRKTRSNETSHQKLRFQTFLCPLTRPSDTLSKSGEGNKADCSVCGKNVDENMMFSPLTLTLSLKGRGNYEIRFIQMPTFQRYLKFLEYLRKATF